MAKDRVRVGGQLHRRGNSNDRCADPRCDARPRPHFALVGTVNLSRQRGTPGWFLDIGTSRHDIRRAEKMRHHRNASTLLTSPRFSARPRPRRAGESHQKGLCSCLSDLPRWRSAQQTSQCVPFAHLSGRPAAPGPRLAAAARACELQVLKVGVCSMRAPIQSRTPDAQSLFNL